MATGTKKGKAAKVAEAIVAAPVAPVAEKTVAPTSAFGKVFGMVNNQVEAVAAKKTDSDTLEIKMPASLADKVDEKGVVTPGTVSQFLSQSATKAAAEGAMKTLGAVIRPELEAARVAESRAVKNFQMSVNVDGKLTFSAGNYNVVGPDMKKVKDVPIPAQIQQTGATLEKIFGAALVVKYFKASNNFVMKKRLANCAEATSDEDAQVALIGELQKIMGARFGEFFSWEPCIEVIKAKEGSVLLDDATMDDQIALKVKQAKAEGVLDQSEGRLASRKAGTAGKGK